MFSDTYFINFRLTPVIIVWIYLIRLVLQFRGSGPLWSDAIDSVLIPCEMNIWSTLLYFQNYWNVDHMVSFVFFPQNLRYEEPPDQLVKNFRFRVSAFSTFGLRSTSSDVERAITFNKRVGRAYIARN